MTRSFSRITSRAALALAITAVAAPAATAAVGPHPIVGVTPDARDAARPVVIDRVTPDARDAGRPDAPISRVTPDAQDAGRPAPAIDRVTPDARDNGRRETPPIVLSPPPVVAIDRFDWLDAGVGAAALLLLAAGTAGTVRMRRRPARAT